MLETSVIIACINCNHEDLENLQNTFLSSLYKVDINFKQFDKQNLFIYTGGILQWLDIDVHSAVTAKTSTECCDNDGADSNVRALTVTALGHQWL